MRKIYFLLAILLMLAGSFISCQNKEPVTPPITSLENTLWQLVGMVDINTGELRTLQPNFESNFRLRFDVDTIRAQGWFSFIVSTYKVDYTTGAIVVANVPIPLYKDDDGRLFIASILTAQTFTLQENELRLFGKASCEKLMYMLRFEDVPDEFYYLGICNIINNNYLLFRFLKSIEQ